ncbi:MAG: VTT domain-containing protein [Anaerolineae bacterium]|nr:VTT domain-containing protein [Anaerolineae bacterium]
MRVITGSQAIKLDDTMTQSPQPVTPSETRTPAAPRGLPWGRILSVIIAITVTLVVATLANQIQQLQALGYAGAFLIMLLGNATIVLPMPGLIFVIAMGSTLNPWLLGLAAGPGAALGELTGYLAGHGGVTPVEDTAFYRRFYRSMDRFGPLVIFILSMIPNPFFDIAGMLAGASHMPWWQFLLSATLGKTVQATALAWAGALSLDWITQFFV